jgi:hypothetical protein
MQRVNVSRRLRRKCKREKGKAQRRCVTFLLIQQNSSLRSGCEALRRHGLLGRLEDYPGQLQNSMERPHRAPALAATSSSFAGGWRQGRADCVARPSGENRLQCFGISASSIRFASFVMLFLVWSGQEAPLVAPRNRSSGLSQRNYASDPIFLRQSNEMRFSDFVSRLV